MYERNVIKENENLINEKKSLDPFYMKILLYDLGHNPSMCCLK